MGDGHEYEDWGEPDEPEESDQYEEWMERCGSRRKGQCDLAGSEECDWSCPFHNEVFRPRRKA